MVNWIISLENINVCIVKIYVVIFHYNKAQTVTKLLGINISLWMTSMKTETTNLFQHC